MRYLTLLICSFSVLFPLPPRGTKFYLTNEPIDVVIPTVEKDFDVLKLCVKGIRKNGKHIRRVIVISKTPLEGDFEWISEDSFPFSFEDITYHLAKGDINLIRELKRTKRTGWYFQQLLKLYSPSVIAGVSSNVLVLDSDTVFLRPTKFLNKKNGGFYSFENEYTESYFTHAKKLIPGFDKKYDSYSGVAHHMLFQRSVIERLFDEVEEFHQKPFWKIFCELVDSSDIHFAGASEYEIYFNYIFSCSNQFTLRKLKNGIKYKLKDIDLNKKTNYDNVSLHHYRRVDIPR